MKWFCPWCSLQLISNQAGAGHVNENEAWGRFECEYQVGDFSAVMQNNFPVSELQREKANLAYHKLVRRQTNKLIKETTEKVAQLQAEWDQERK